MSFVCSVLFAYHALISFSFSSNHTRPSDYAQQRVVPTGRAISCHTGSYFILYVHFTHSSCLLFFVLILQRYIDTLYNFHCSPPSSLVVGHARHVCSSLGLWSGRVSEQDPYLDALFGRYVFVMNVLHRRNC
jgi:hypothetical protein